MSRIRILISLSPSIKEGDVVFFVADNNEISPAEVPFPVVFTGMGKMRMFTAFVNDGPVTICMDTKNKEM